MIRSVALIFALAFGSTLTACDRPNFTHDDAAATAAADVSDDHVLIVADVHLDPFDRKDLVDQLAAAPIERWAGIFSQNPGGDRTSSYGHDSNAALFLSSLRAMKTAIPHPAYVLIAGDLFAHDFYKRFSWTASNNDKAAFAQFVDKTADFITYELTQTYPHTQMFPTIGNNDGYCGDYASTPHDGYLAHQSAKWAPIIDPQHRFPDVETTFAKGGYYRAETASGLRIISLNTVFLSNMYKNRCGDLTEHPAEPELAWLQGVLPTPNAEPTLMLTHIPVGIDGFKTFFHLGFPVPLLAPAYQTTFLTAVNAAQSHITAIITGHLHDVGYRQTHEGSADNKPVLISPSISPIFGNSPAFSIALISKTGAIEDFEVHRLQSVTSAPPTWDNVVDFNQRYHLHGVNTDSIESIHQLQNDDRRMRSVVERDSVGNAPALAVMTLDWKSLWCTNNALTPEAFLRCEGVRGDATPSHHQ